MVELPLKRLAKRARVIRRDSVSELSADARRVILNLPLQPVGFKK